MPVGAVKTASQEKSWNRAKSIVNKGIKRGKKLKKVKKGSDRYWKIVMTVYENIEKSK